MLRVSSLCFIMSEFSAWKLEWLGVTRSFGSGIMWKLLSDFWHLDWEDTKGKLSRDYGLQVLFMILSCSMGFASMVAGLWEEVFCEGASGGWTFQENQMDTAWPFLVQLQKPCGTTFALFYWLPLSYQGQLTFKREQWDSTSMRKWQGHMQKSRWNGKYCCNHFWITQSATHKTSVGWEHKRVKIIYLETL